jgi:hypothetical protein
VDNVDNELRTVNYLSVIACLKILTLHSPGETGNFLKPQQSKVDRVVVPPEYRSEALRLCGTALCIMCSDCV